MAHNFLMSLGGVGAIRKDIIEGGREGRGVIQLLYNNLNLLMIGRLLAR